MHGGHFDYFLGVADWSGIVAFFGCVLLGAVTVAVLAGTFAFVRSVYRGEL